MNTTEITVKMLLDRWFALIQRLDKDLDLFTDEDLQKEIAPGRNRGIYLLGHLIAVHDEMILLLDFGTKLYPELHETFLNSADKTSNSIPSAKELKLYWKKQNDFLSQKFTSLKPEEWFEKHTAVSSEDFSKEPHRNKLNILITRTSHLSYHVGQFALLTKK